MSEQYEKAINWRELQNDFYATSYSAASMDQVYTIGNRFPTPDFVDLSTALVGAVEQVRIDHPITLKLGGSYAAGQWVRGSDLDLSAIYAGTSEVEVYEDISGAVRDVLPVEYKDISINPYYTRLPVYDLGALDGLLAQRLTHGNNHFFDHDYLMVASLLFPGACIPEIPQQIVDLHTLSVLMDNGAVINADTFAGAFDPLQSNHLDSVHKYIKRIAANYPQTESMTTVLETMNNLVR